jgi:IMP cyclohydrolase
MYIGRFVIYGETAQGQPYLGYRVSSRSFPNRRIHIEGDRAVVLPTPDAPPTNNPYISYNCLRQHAGIVVVANGSHVDPIIDKVSLGYGLRDALALALLALDYERDQYNTPRIVAALNGPAGRGYLGIIADDRLMVREVNVAAGEANLVATYERTDPTPIALQGATAEALCDALYTCEYEHPVAALAALWDDGALKMAARSAR